MELSFGWGDLKALTFTFEPKPNEVIPLIQIPEGDFVEFDNGIITSRLNGPLDIKFYCK